MIRWSGPIALLGLGLALLAGCQNIAPPAASKLSSFRIEPLVLYRGSGPSRIPLPVVTPCADRYGGQDQVPFETDAGVRIKGTQECRYAIARGDIEIDVVATALDSRGKTATGFNGPVSFRVVPGDLVGGYASRTGSADGGVVFASVRTQHQYGLTRLWAEDAPPSAIYSDGGVVPGAPVEPAHRSYATGLSPAIYFEEPTLAGVQIPDGYDNRSSPLVGEFLTIGKVPESGERLLQACTDDPKRNGQPALMVVTGTDPSGFYVTDVSACRQIELTDAGFSDQAKVLEPKEPCQQQLNDGTYVPIEQWDGGSTDGGPARCQISQGICTQTSGCRSYLPGTFGSMFIYNYSFPDGLDEGDLLWTLSGSVQEFTSTTQMTFPSWSIAEKVRLLPPEQWNKWLQYARPFVIANRECGADNVLAPFLTDQLCGHNKRNLKMESLESALVKVPNVRFPSEFINCDFNSDGTVPFFCETKDQAWFWASCAFPPSPPESAADAVERQCNVDCVTGTGAHQGKICSERATFTGFGQFVVELNPSGPARFGFDESLPARIQNFVAGATAVKPASAYGPTAEVNLACDAEVRLVFNDGSVAATTTDLPLAANTVLNHVLSPPENTVSVIVPGGGTANCWIAQNAHSRINVITKDALPELQPDCRLDDPDDEKGKQCSFLRGVTFDVTGHLKQVQPGRPRWLITPRDADDVCCHPGPGLSCPKPVKPCL